ncbi:MAG: coproporphyrinogen dehydrogenase HemZ [Firmicutes bacterium]|nr:coproporphyrinogen dehydrogenase HemZ [Bacillota bacterium]
MFICQKEEYYSELFNIVRQFKKHETRNISCLFEDDKFIISLNDKITAGEVSDHPHLKKNERNDAQLNSFNFNFTKKSKKETLFFLKTTLYKVLSKYFNETLPWGALTGIRPTKLVYDALDGGKSVDEAKEFLIKNYFVSEDKAALTCEIVQNQKPYLLSNEEKNNFVNLYIHIPFCPSRCNYCSFVTLETKKFSHLIELYFEKLITELKHDLSLIKFQNKKIYSVYIGGGTPSCLPLPMIKKLLSYLTFDCEITFEAGRSDTITKELLEVLKEGGVTRICLNPQTLSDDTLKKIGRVHTAKDFFDAYDLIKKRNFTINCDLIYGIDETEKDFQNTLEKIIELKPHNITVHTLSSKKGSKASQESKKSDSVWESNINVRYITNQLEENNYHPYYLYRQKEQLSNLDNIGYSLKKYECINNISVMEELLSVMAIGAGAISKQIFHKKDNTQIERFANLRDVQLYINRFDEILKKKGEFFIT